MEILKNVLTILSIVGIPSLVTAFGFNRIIKHMDSERAVRDEHMFLLMQLSATGMELSEAVAISYKSQRCNGEISSALVKAQKIKQEYTDFLTKQCIRGIQ